MNKTILLKCESSQNISFVKKEIQKKIIRDIISNFKLRMGNKNGFRMSLSITVWCNNYRKKILQQ